jgi:hypothetical protein
LEDLARRAVSRDLDAIAREVEWVRREVAVLRLASGLPSGPLGRAERRAQALEMRSAGYSVRAISRALRVRRETIAQDFRELGVPPAPIVTGLDGRQVRGPRPTNGGRNG